MLSERETFLVVFAESKGLPNQVEWIVATMEGLHIEVPMKEVEELVTEYEAVQADVLDLVKYRHKQMEKLEK